MNKGFIFCVAIFLSACFFNVNQSFANNPNSQNKSAWISIGTDAANVIQKKYATSISMEQFSFVAANQSNITIARVPENSLDAISEIMHHDFHRCGGYFYHESLEDAQNYVASIQNVVISAVNYSIDNPTGVSTLLGELSSTNLTSTVSSLAAFNNRYYTSQSGVDAATWIRDRWQEIGSSRSDFNVELYQHSWQQPSVIATITGSTNPQEVVVIGGHLDSINQSNRAGRAPGADDNASGIAVITETLRAIVSSGYKPERTIKFMGYAAEEVGLRGSRAIAQAFKAAGEDVVGVSQFDMTGYQGTSNRDIVFMTDYTSSAQNDFMTQLLDTYHQDIIYGFSQCGYACSDHASWTNEGFPASIPFESNLSDANPTIHTANDTSFDPEHAIKFAKLSVTYIAELAKGGVGPAPTVTPSPSVTPTPTAPPQQDLLENNVPRTGLAATRNEDLVYRLVVPEGAQNISFNISGGSGDADLYVRFGAEPTDSTYDCRPYRNGNNEACTGTQSGGTYYVRVKAYATFSGVSLIGRFDEPGSTPPGAEPIDETIADVSVARQAWGRYTQDLESGYRRLTISISGGTGDADLYVREGQQPSTSTYDCRPYRNGNSEECVFENPGSGTWHIGVYGYRASQGVTLNIKADPE